MTDQPFDPAKHLSKVSGRDYLEVKWRLVWLRSVQPDAKIATELVEHRNNMAVFRAEVTLPSGASASGYGSEGTDDFGDYIEKAETKAIGRALAALGFGTQFTSDHDFGADRQRVVDSPTDIRSARPQQPQSGGNRQEATPRQIRYMHAVAREIGLSGDDLEARCQQSFGMSIDQMGRREVSAMIEQLQAEKSPMMIAPDEPTHTAPSAPTRSEAEYLDWIDSIEDKRNLAEILQSIDEHGLRANPIVWGAYVAKWEQLHGKKAPV